MGISKVNEIQVLIENADAFNDEINSTFGSLSAAQLNWKPDVSVWSIAQCLEHLIVTNDLYFENIRKVADGTHKNNLFSKIPLIPDIVAFGMKKVLGPNWKGKMKTFKMFEPKSSEFSEKILGDFSEHQAKFIDLMTATKNLDYRGIIVAEPIGAAVNIRLVDAFEVLVLHEKRHFNQAKRILGNPGFPVDKGDSK